MIGGTPGRSLVTSFGIVEVPQSTFCYFNSWQFEGLSANLNRDDHESLAAKRLNSSFRLGLSGSRYFVPLTELGSNPNLLLQDGALLFQEDKLTPQDELQLLESPLRLHDAGDGMLSRSKKQMADFVSGDAAENEGGVFSALGICRQVRKVVVVDQRSGRGQGTSRDGIEVNILFGAGKHGQSHEVRVTGSPAGRFDDGSVGFHGTIHPHRSHSGSAKNPLGFTFCCLQAWRGNLPEVVHQNGQDGCGSQIIGSDHSRA